MADALLSFALENIANLATNEVELLRGVKEEVDKFSRTFIAIQASLHDAEMRQFNDRSEQVWMTQLKYIEYEVDDVLDEWKSKSHQLSINNIESGSSVWNFLSQCTCFLPLVLRHNIGKRLKKISEKLDQIAKDKNRLNFQQNATKPEVGSSRETSSCVVNSEVFGREVEKNKITRLLINEGTYEPLEIPVISIVGMGGCGKTTLAQLLFNEDEVRHHFQELIWVCVSDEFDAKNILKKILEAIKKELPNATGLEALQKRLWDNLTNKRFLLVLDDVWNEDYAKWETLVNILKKCEAKGSRIIVTTRNEKVAEVMASKYVHKLDPLSFEECWSIFRKVAFEGRDESEYSGLIPIGEEIVAKCKGLPLAIKTVAGALRAASKREWENALADEIWHSHKEGVLPALSISYYHLPPPLKRCFRYCSLFPKDFILRKKVLVKLWVAQGYVTRDGDKEIEDISEGYFEELLQRSLFQEPKSDEFGNILTCKMHDMVHDLAQFVANGEFALNAVSEDNSKFDSSKVRHCAWIDQNVDQTSLIAFENLRTLFMEDVVLGEDFHVSNRLLKQLRCMRALTFSWAFPFIQLVIPMKFLESIGKLVHLRYLNLSGSATEALPEAVMKLWNLRYLNLSCTLLKQLPESVGKLCQLRHLNLRSTSIEKLPESVGKLCQLRHLNLKRTSIEKLPDSIADLCHLQVLDLNYCRRLCELPSGIDKITSLKRLGIDGTFELKTFPAGIGTLTSLEQLDRFILTEGQCNLSELRHLNRIRGSLRIENLELGSREEAVTAKLEDKTSLQELGLRWSGEQEKPSSFREEQEEPSRAEGVLEALRPPPSLRELEIWSYRGLKFPGWVGEPTFSSLDLVRLSDCENCIELPALGNLPQLRSLYISGMPNVRKVGCEFFGSSNKNGWWFPKLEDLSFSELLNWEEWDTSSSLPSTTTTPGGVAQMMMPCLRSLEIESCQKLKALPPIFSQALKEMALHNCLNLRCGLESIPPSIQNLGCSPARILSTLPSLPMLNYLTIGPDDDVIELPHDLIRFTELQTLNIFSCSNLTSLPEEIMSSLKKLRKLSIFRCPLLKESCKMEGKQWSKIAHIPRIEIDLKTIQDHK